MFQIVWKEIFLQFYLDFLLLKDIEESFLGKKFKYVDVWTATCMWHNIQWFHNNCSVSNCLWEYSNFNNKKTIAYSIKLV